MNEDEWKTPDTIEEALRDFPDLYEESGNLKDLAEKLVQITNTYPPKRTVDPMHLVCNRLINSMRDVADQLDKLAAHVGFEQ